MFHRKFLKVMTIAGACVVSSAALAQATEALVTTDLNIRTGPSTDYQRFDTIPGGSHVDVNNCLAGYNWCDVNWAGTRGWVSGNYLAYLGSTYYREPIARVGVSIGVPVVTYDFDDYNRRYYHGRYRHHRAVRRHIRQERREHRRDVRQERRQEHRQDVRENRRERRQEIRENRRERRQEIRQNRRQERRQNMRERRQERRQDVRQNRREHRQEVRQNKRQHRQEVRQNRREQRQDKRGQVRRELDRMNQHRSRTGN